MDINGHFYKCAIISQRLVTFIQTPGKKLSFRVWPYSGPGTSPVHLNYPGHTRSNKHNTAAIMVMENSDFLGLETPDSLIWFRFIKIKEQRLKLKNKTVLASRPGAISMCFPQALWHLQTSARSDLLFARSRLRGLAFWLDRNGGKTERKSSDSGESESLQAHVKQCHR